MTVANLQNLFSIDYPTVQTHLGRKFIGPVTLPFNLKKQIKSKMECYLFAGDKEDYVVCLFGKIDHADNVLVRVSSACTFGFILNSLLCDCKSQFEEAIERMVDADSGILIFGIDQHGKGIGLEAHFLVYAEGQRRGKGLFSEIYQDLGLDQDYRDYNEVATILSFLREQKNFKSITMLTEAPDKRKFFAEKCAEMEMVVRFDKFNTEVTPENKSELSEKIANGYDMANLEIA
jgi:GTP cyclohydrolase II